MTHQQKIAETAELIVLLNRYFLSCDADLNNANYAALGRELDRLRRLKDKIESMPIANLKKEYPEETVILQSKMNETLDTEVNQG